MKYLVTGGAGFIGSHFVRRLAEKKPKGELDSIHIIDNLTYASDFSLISDLVEKKLISFNKVDISSIEEIETNFGSPDIVVNFAAETHVDNSIAEPELFIKTNIFGTYNLLEASRKKEVKKFIQISTDEVYGSVFSGESTEDAPILPNSPYAASKASADMLVRAYFETYQLRTIITRCTNNYGTGQNAEKFIPKSIENLKNGLPIPIYGNGENQREWIHVEDHVDGILSAIEFGIPGNIYNFGSGFRVNNLEIARIIAENLGIKRDYIEFVEDRKGHDFRYALDSTKSRDELGFSPKRDFEKEIGYLVTQEFKV